MKTRQAQTSFSSPKDPASTGRQYTTVPESQFSRTVFEPFQKIPAFKALSEKSLLFLITFLTSGNANLRVKKLSEFLKTVDWLEYEALDFTLFKGLTSLQQDQIARDIRAYFAAKNADKLEAREQRKRYQHKVFEHFRQNVQREDKILLESLRDYELNLTGRDTNWQFYFNFPSMKQIDQFVAMPSTARHERIDLFKKDVETYKKNYDRLTGHGPLGEDACGGFDFDVWCELFGDETIHTQARQGAGSKQNGNTNSHPSRTENTSMANALLLFQLTHACQFSDVKKRFRELTLLHHPDMEGGNEDTMKQVLIAYDVLKNHFKNS